MKQQHDPADLIQFGIFHGQANPDRLQISDVDELQALATKFTAKHSRTNWEKQKVDWMDSIAIAYNAYVGKGRNNWNKVPMADD